MTRTDLLALAERVEAGSGADTKLASEIFYALGQPRVTAYLTSLDAVEALRERLLPGSTYAIDAYSSSVRASIWPHDVTGRSGSSAKTAPRAFLAALLRAYAETVGG